jgi:hypothetical protein
MTSGLEQERDRELSLAQAPRALLGRWFASTGAQPAWALVAYMVAGLTLGAALAAPLPEVEATLLSALTGSIVAATGSGGPSGIARRVALGTAAATLVLTFVAFATGNRPLLAALAMAAVAILTWLAAGAGPLGAVLAYLLSLTYLLVAGLSRVADLVDVVSLSWAAAHIAVGCVVGLLVVFVATWWRRRSEPDGVRAARAEAPIRSMWASLRSFDRHARDGVRRAIPLAILMYLFQLDAGRDAFWIFFAAYSVLLTPGKTAVNAAFVRAGSAVLAWYSSPSRRSSSPTRRSSCSGSSSSSRASASVPLSDPRRRAHDDRLDPARRRADGRDRSLGAAPPARRAARVCDRAGRDVPALAARPRNGGDGAGPDLTSGQAPRSPLAASRRSSFRSSSSSRRSSASRSLVSSSSRAASDSRVARATKVEVMIAVTMARNVMPYSITALATSLPDGALGVTSP